MPSERWTRLEQQLLTRGWTCDENEVLCAPHETMQLARCADEPDLASLRARMSRTAERAWACIARSPDHAELYDDLVSLVDAIDDVVESEPIDAHRDAAPFEHAYAN